MTTVFQRIGPYEIVREIGRGGMAAVFLADDARVSRPVQVRVVTADRPGILSTVTGAFVDSGLNISEATCRSLMDGRSVNTFQFTVGDASTLSPSGRCAVGVDVGEAAPASHPHEAGGDVRLDPFQARHPRLSGCEGPR